MTMPDWDDDEDQWLTDNWPAAVDACTCWNVEHMEMWPEGCPQHRNEINT